MKILSNIGKILSENGRQRALCYYLENYLQNPIFDQVFF